MSNWSIGTSSTNDSIDLICNWIYLFLRNCADLKIERQGNQCEFRIRGELHPSSLA